MGDVIDLQVDMYATCECGSQDYMLIVDDAGDKWNTILGFECLGCGYNTELAAVITRNWQRPKQMIRQ